MADYKVPLTPQRTDRVCWEACGRAMWNWYYRNDLGQQNYYKYKAGPFATLDKGLDDRQLAGFYQLLGLRRLENPKGINVRYALQWSPVIVAYKGVSGRAGHMVAVCGTDGRNYTVMNPIGRLHRDFDGGADTWQASKDPVTHASLDSQLGPQIFYW